MAMSSRSRSRGSACCAIRSCRRSSSWPLTAWRSLNEHFYKGRHARTLSQRQITMSNDSLGPADEHDQSLLEHVHPLAWTNPEPRPRYHLVVIGAGTAGLVSAAGAAGLGAKVALVEG